MRGMRRLAGSGFTGVLLALITAGAPAQDTSLRVVDRVDLPLVLEGQDGQDLYIEFREMWTINPERGSILKEAGEYRVFDRSDPGPEREIPGEAFREMIRGRSGGQGKIRFLELEYEFMLVDHETGVLNNLHAPLSRLVREKSPMAGNYSLDKQLLSVYFHETWYLEGETITRKVIALIPVIWQRRQTDEGIPVDDPDSGLPVYYRLELNEIPLRNP
jgi:hypothetical protein